MKKIEMTRNLGESYPQKLRKKVPKNTVIHEVIHIVHKKIPLTTPKMCFVKIDKNALFYVIFQKLS